MSPTRFFSYLQFLLRYAKIFLKLKSFKNVEMGKTKRTTLQSFENATLPLKKKSRKELLIFLRFLASDNSLEAYTIRCRIMNIIGKDDVAQFEKLVNRRDFLLKKMRRGQKLTDKEENLIETVGGLLSEH